MANVDLNRPLPTSDDFPSNSFKSRKKQEERPKIQKIITGSVVRKKKSFGRKLVDIFISEDIEDVKGYILYEVLIPSIKTALSDAIGGGADMLLGTSVNRKKTYSNGKNTPYGTFYKSGSTDRSIDKTRRIGYDYEDIILETRGEAEKTLSTLVDYIDQYGAVRLSDLQEMVGTTGQFTDTYWGWTNLADASVKRVRDGYLLNLPRIENLR